MKRTGRPPMTDQQIREVIRSRIVRGPGCWRWKGYHRKTDGRPIFVVRGVRRYAYAWVFELLTGRKIEGILHHTCSNKWCVRPDHLVDTTQPEHAAGHLRERNRKTAAERTHCPSGHEYTAENTIVVNSTRDGQYRKCRTCQQETKARYRARRKAEAA